MRMHRPEASSGIFGSSPHQRGKGLHIDKPIVTCQDKRERPGESFSSGGELALAGGRPVN